MKFNNFILVFILTNLSNLTFGQFDYEIYDKISNAMNFKKWNEIQTISIVYENKQKNKEDKDLTFENIKASSIESLVADKNLGFRYEIKSDLYTIITKDNKEYFSMTSSIDNWKPDKTYHDQINGDINYVTHNGSNQLTLLMNTMIEYKDSLRYIKNMNIYGEDCRLYFGGILSNPFFKFLIDKNDQVRGFTTGYKSQNQYYFVDYKNFNDIPVPQGILTFSEEYSNFYTLLDFKINIDLNKRLFY